VAAPTRSEFVAKFPVFASTSTTIIDYALADAIALLDAQAWGTYYAQGVMLVTAHNLVLSSMAGTSVLAGTQGTAGPVTSVSAAGVSTTFANPPVRQKSTSLDWYDKTIYGQQYIRLRNAVIPPADISL
jgi:hypothetical protein